jgi:hypothetical protein
MKKYYYINELEMELSVPKRTIAHPSEVDPKSKAKRYRIPAISTTPPCF